MQGDEIRKEQQDLQEPQCIADESHKTKIYGDGLLTHRYIEQIFVGTDVLASDKQEDRI